MEPVWVWEGAGLSRQLNDVGDAALFLLYKWPKAEMTSEEHQAARMAALRALEGKGTAEAFRKAFVKAAERAQILAEPPQRSDVKLSNRVAQPWAYRKGRRRRG